MLVRVSRPTARRWVELDAVELSGFDVTVDVATSDGTATRRRTTAQSPAQPPSLPERCRPRCRSRLSDDPDIEGDEQFTLGLSEPRGTQCLLTPTITVTIRDDDGTALFDDGLSKPGGHVAVGPEAVP